MQKALDDLLVTGPKRTTIVIAHRLSTVRNADLIVVLGSPDGTSTARGSVIMEQGTHDELIGKKGGLYAALASAGEREVGKDNNVDVSDAVKRSLEESRLDETTVEVSASSAYSAVSASSAAAADDEGNKEGMCGGLFGGGKKKNKSGAPEEEAYVVPKSRIWEYSRSEYGWIAFGSLGSLIKGTCLPLVSLAFAEMINSWYSSNTDEIRSDSLSWSYVFYALALLQLVTETIQKWVFEMVGERLCRRLRSDLFRGMLRQDITWFEDEKNSQGALMSRLSTDVKFVRFVTGQSVGATMETVAALTTGIIISLVASWQIFLIMLAMVPLLGVCEVFQ